MVTFGLFFQQAHGSEADKRMRAGLTVDENDGPMVKNEQPVVKNGQAGGEQVNRWQSLEICGRDREWVERQNKYNMDRNYKVTFEHPCLQIVAGKRVKVSYAPYVGEAEYTGGLTVTFQEFPRKDTGRPMRELKLSEPEYTMLENKFEGIKEFIRAVEGESDHSVGEVLGAGVDKQWQVRDIAKGLKQCKIPFPAGAERFIMTFTWNPVEKTCTVGIDRKWIVDEATGELVVGKPSREGLCLSAKGLDYFLKFCADCVRNGIKAWIDHKHFCEAVQAACLVDYEPIYYDNDEYTGQNFMRSLPVQDMKKMTDEEIICSQKRLPKYHPSLRMIPFPFDDE